MVWRLVVTVVSFDTTDVAFSYGKIAVIPLLELWLGLLAANAPVVSLYLRCYIKPSAIKIFWWAKKSGTSIRRYSRQKSCGGTNTSVNPDCELGRVNDSKHQEDPADERSVLEVDASSSLLLEALDPKSKIEHYHSTIEVQSIVEVRSDYISKPTLSLGKIEHGWLSL